jgi:DNA-binding transcriptional MerR regulator
MVRTVSAVARTSGITVRTLHHYDEIGLLVPSERSEAGYRLYSTTDLERLQEILFYRELGLPLDEISRLMDEPGAVRSVTLRRQRALLEERSRHLQAMVDAIDLALLADEEGIPMGDDDMFEVFGGFDPKQYEAETEERWGETPAFQESQRRTSRYGKDEWQAIKDEGGACAQALADLMTSGAPADGEAAMDAADAYRLHIDRWFYPCSHEMMRGLGGMYVADPRFTAFWANYAEGLAGYVRDAIDANAERATV